jgi:hypothetical protein
MLTPEIDDTAALVLAMAATARCAGVRRFVVDM